MRRLGRRSANARWDAAVQALVGLRDRGSRERGFVEEEEEDQGAGTDDQEDIFLPGDLLGEPIEEVIEEEEEKEEEQDGRLSIDPASIIGQTDLAKHNATCPICRCVVEQATSCCPQGHCFCFLCLKRWLREKNECPTCRHKTGTENLVRSIPFLISTGGRRRLATGLCLKPARRVSLHCATMTGGGICGTCAGIGSSSGCSFR